MSSSSAGRGGAVRSLLAVLGAACVFALLLAAPASASLEQVANFAESGEGEGALDAGVAFSNALAVNTTGAGGVPAGTFYGVANPTGHSRVNRFSPTGEFRGAWGWRVSSNAGFSQQFERCGPDGEAAHPTCLEKGGGLEGEGEGQLFRPVDIAVDQSTGYVYVRNEGQRPIIPGNPVREHNLIQVFSADGSQLIDEFGDLGAQGETAEEGPEKFHDATFGYIAVNTSGDVYVSDSPKGGPRVMIWKPQSPGDYENYAYSGRANDIAIIGEGLTFDDAGNLYTKKGGGAIKMFAPGETAPKCEFVSLADGMIGMAVDPASGRVFYWDYKTPKVIYQLGACNAQGEFPQQGEFPLAPPPGSDSWLQALAFNPALAWEDSRPQGILYAFDGVGSNFKSLGYIFAPAEVRSPRVESESVSALTATTANLGAQINPQGSITRYAFQYLTESAYEANEPDERQSLTVSATGGLFGLGLEGRRYGGPFTATLSSGSSTATALTTAKGTATLKGAKGTVTMKAAKGTGTVISGSTAITAVAAAEGTFEVGQQISGTGIPAGTTISAVKAGELTISSPATASKANTELSAGQVKVTALNTTEGAFEVGQQISGTGVPADTTILAVAPSSLTLSNPVTKPGTGVAIAAGSNVLSTVSTTEGSFEVGQAIEGEGIPAGTTIEAVGVARLTLSKAITKQGSGVAIAATGPGPLSAGQAVEGPGIPAGTRIESVKAGELTLSAPATVSGSAVQLNAGLPFDATAAEVRKALESLPAIGAGNVKVSGGPGGEAGSSPYEIQFTGTLANTDVEQIEAFDLGLSGGSASAAVSTANDGGNGFDGASETPVGGAELGSGQEALSAAASATGLTPDTAYRYRVLASSHCDSDHEEELCEDVGAPQGFRTFATGAVGLPDDRAWELVSPTEKQGGEVFSLYPKEGSSASCFTGGCKPGFNTNTFPQQSSPDGEGVVYQGFPFSGTEGAAILNEYVSTRTPSGWKTTILAPAAMSGFYEAFDPALARGVLTQPTAPSLTAAAPSEYANLYAQPTADPASLAPLVGTQPPNRPAATAEGPFNVQFAGASEDLSHIFFAANDALSAATPFAPAASDPGTSGRNLYESVGGELRLVNVAPGNAASVPGAFFGSKGLTDLPGAISADGSVAYWSDEAGQLYARIDGERTLEVQGTGKFLAASADGWKVLLDDGCLYDLEAEACEDLTGGQGGFKGIVGQSEDLSHVYFVATAVLTGEEENEYGARAVKGENNLYAWHEGETSFIATLLPTNDLEDWAAAPTQRTAQASPSGRWLAFLSRAPLSGYENVGPTCSIDSNGKYSTGRCAEAFLYDLATGRLRCASCSPGGAPPLGWTNLPVASGFHIGALPQPRYLTDSGRLYFDSRDALSPLDTNRAVEGPDASGKPSGAGKGGAEDVYQYEPEGVGGCTREGGCVALLSGGRGSGDSNFFAIDETGKSVFFTTRDRLVPQDHDELVDLYVAREGGGIAPAERQVECQGEACQPAARAPNDPTPSSAGFQGPGNVKGAGSRPRCPKGKRRVARKGKSRCVKRNAKRAPRRANRKRGGAR